MLLADPATLSSDHLAILIRLQKNAPSNPSLCRPYVNLKKANWDRYRQEVEAAMCKRSLPTDCQRVESIFRTVLPKVASHPYWTHRLHEEPIPAEILDVMDSRDDLRKRAPTDTAYKWWSYHRGHRLLCKLCRTFLPPAMGAQFNVFFCGKLAMPTRWIASTAPHKSG